MNSIWVVLVMVAALYPTGSLQQINNRRQQYGNYPYYGAVPFPDFQPAFDDLFYRIWQSSLDHATRFAPRPFGGPGVSSGVNFGVSSGPGVGSGVGVSSGVSSSSFGSRPGGNSAVSAVNFGTGSGGTAVIATQTAGQPPQVLRLKTPPGGGSYFVSSGDKYKPGYAYVSSNSIGPNFVSASAGASSSSG